jgi:hypothetical protein
VSGPLARLSATSAVARRASRGATYRASTASLACKPIFVFIAVPCCLTGRSSGTSAGKPLGPPPGLAHHPVSGPSAFPATAP